LAAEAEWVTQLKAAAIRWRAHPEIFVREVFKTTPDPWQDEVLQAFPHEQRIALPASKGPGKSACLAWLAWNFIVVYPYSNIAMTSISGQNLQDGLWKEIAKWHAKSPLLQQMFEVQATRVISKESPKTWFMTARTWQKTANVEEQAATLAGFHADYLLFLLDETGDMPTAVMASADAALSTGKVTKMVQAGNTLKREGPLWRACTTERGRWFVVRITGDPDDPKRSPRVDIEWARQMIALWGRDNAWVKVNVLGEFPEHSINALIGPDEMAAAANRSYRDSDNANAPKLLGIDVARQGDDASVMFPRQGLVALTPTVWRGVDGIQGAGAVARRWSDWGADAVFIDNTGGFGASWIDNLRLLGRSPIGVIYNGEPHDRRYYNKRAEMYFLLVEWIKGGGQLPPCPELVEELTQITYTHKGDRLLLEDKLQLKSRIGRSPDHADALASTFAEPITSRRTAEMLPRAWGARRLHRAEYDPYSIDRLVI
jgi:hypothetical protein